MADRKGYHKFVPDALKGKAKWSGTTDIASGDSSVVISATQIVSGAAIMTGLGLTSVASHQPRVCSVNSIVANTSMVLQVDAALVEPQQVWYTIIEN